MKKKFSAILVVGLLAAVMLFVAACGGAPGWVNNPPSDPQELITRLRDNDWEYDDEDLEGNYGEIFASRASHTWEELAEFADTATTSVWFETIVVYYAANEAAAIAEYNEMRTMIDAQSAEIPSGVTHRYSLNRNGTIVSMWSRTSGNWNVIRDAILGSIDMD